MAPQVRVHADLTFTARAPADAQSWGGSIRGDGRDLEIVVDTSFRLRGRSPRRVGRRLAWQLADQGLTLTVTGPDGPLVRLGDVPTRFLERLLTGSPDIRVLSWRRAARGVFSGASGVDLADVLPPPTPWPPAPTFRRLRRNVTTTHDPRGGGRPRLVFSVGPAPQDGVRRRVFYLAPGTTTIGSGADCDLQLADVPDQVARIVRDDQDEYRVEPLPGGDVRVNGEQQPSTVLRTGSRVRIGPWEMSYFREEFADHGRPHGGRQGGEFSHQRPQTAPTIYGRGRSPQRRRRR